MREQVVKRRDSKDEGHEQKGGTNEGVNLSGWETEGDISTAYNPTSKFE